MYTYYRNLLDALMQTQTKQYQILVDADKNFITIEGIIGSLSSVLRMSNKPKANNERLDKNQQIYKSI